MANMHSSPYMQSLAFQQEPDTEAPPKLEELISSREFDKTFLEQRRVFLWGVVDDHSAREVVNRLLYLEAKAPGKEITLFINSPGGIVSSGMVIHDTMQLISSPVATVCMGLAASMGSIILSAGKKGRRFIFPHGEVMIHQPSIGGYQGTSADLEIQARQIRKTKELGARILAENCGQPIEKILKDFDRDYWMDAQEAVEYGIVDKIIEKL
ncbi:ATP-dependent Clp protease protease subunit [Thermoflavifilum aggregans]|uniref:ATP-dependent Clp protease proteolytic subunit n=1 Tax=Thermoflavifilum aggregans TaxID=454188 RepID=A0A2M9CTI0_9BACT|nr:ATP-dependent Clp protease proteolytic subunit [Thermoflavifilum aggregans]PJJ75203.1 ATP-dependent Clp protease protease subunit [Thermoflavifilum aggregans]